MQDKKIHHRGYTTWICHVEIGCRGAGSPRKRGNDKGMCWLGSLQGR